MSWLLKVPNRLSTALAALIVLAFFVIPLGFIAVYSVYHYSNLHIYTPGFTADNYLVMFSDPFNRRVLIRTLWLSAAATGICLVMGYMIALYLRNAGNKERGLIAIVALIPVLLSDVVLAYAWLVLLARTGPLSAVLETVGLTSGPSSIIGTEYAILLGLVYHGIGYMVLNLHTALEAIGDSELRAAAMLGAGPVTRFFRVTLPMSLPGALSGVLITFAVTSSAFVIPKMLGGTQNPVLPVFVYNMNIFLLNWPVGAAATVVLLIISLSTAYGLIRVGSGRGEHTVAARGNQARTETVSPEFAGRSHA